MSKDKFFNDLLADAGDAPTVTPPESLDTKTVILGTGKHEQTLTFKEWQTRSQLVLEHHYLFVTDLVRNFSIRCLPGHVHSSHAACILQEKLSELLPEISQKHGAYKFPPTLTLELGDEQSPEDLTAEDNQLLAAKLVDTETTAKEWESIKTQLNLVTPDRQPTTTPNSVAEHFNQQRAADPMANSVAAGMQEVVSAAGVQATSVTPETGSSETRRAEPVGYEILVAREHTRPMLEIIREQAALYESIGLPTWAEAARSLEARWNSDPALRATIDRKREAGSLIVAMPSRDVILATTPQLFTTLLHTDVENNRPANQPDIAWDYITKLMNNNGVTSAERNALVAGVPNTPHLMDFIPSERPPADSCSKTLSQQTAWVAEQKQANPNTTDMNLPQYLAAQFILTNKGGKPMDASTYTRFITLQNSGRVAFGDWDPRAGHRQLWFSGDGGSANAGEGVRFVGMN